MWERLGEKVLHRRTSQGWTQDEVAERGGPSDSLQTEIETKRWKPTRSAKGTLTKIDDGLQWVRGSAADVLAGLEPTPISSSLGRGLRKLLPPEASATTPHDEYFDRAERLLRHSRDSTRQGDHLGAIHGLEGAQSTVELLIERISDLATIERENRALEESTQSDASAEVDEDEKTETGSGDDPEDRSGILSAAARAAERMRLKQPEHGGNEGA